MNAKEIVCTVVFQDKGQACKLWYLDDQGFVVDTDADQYIWVGIRVQVKHLQEGRKAKFNDARHNDVKHPVESRYKVDKIHFGGHTGDKQPQLQEAA